MKTKITLFFLTLISISTSYAQSLNWAKMLGGNYNGDIGYAITTDVFGNVYTTGCFADTLDLDPGIGVYNLVATPSGADIFISKLDASGNFVWAKKMATTTVGSNIAYAIATDALGNVYTTGRFQVPTDFDPGPGTFTLTPTSIFDIFISKLDAAGDFVWAKKIGGTGGDQAFGIAVDASSNVYTTGIFEVTVDFDPGPGTFSLVSAGAEDVFVSKLDSNGDFLWAKSFGGGATDQGKSIAVDPSGNVYTTGFYTGTADFDPSATTYGITSVAGSDIFVSKLDAAGNFVWAKSMGGAATERGYGIAIDASRNVYTTGYFGTADFDPGPGTFMMSSAGGNDVFISKLDSTGTFVWAKSIGGSTNDEGRSIAVDPSGNVYTTGYVINVVDFDPGPGVVNLPYTSSLTNDIFLSVLDTDGNYVSGARIGSTSLDECNSVAVDASCNVYMTGRFRGTVDFDPGAGTSFLTTIGGSNDDVFVLKLSCITTEISTENNLANENISVFPNPSNGHFQLNIDNFNSQKINLEIFNAIGERVYTSSITKQQNEIDLSNLPEGIYFVKMISTNQMYQQKIIIQ